MEEAFKRAKVSLTCTSLAETLSVMQNEAGSAHGEDLQALRAESQATIDQLRVAHQTTIDGLKAEHQAALDSQVKSLEKQISKQAIELKATQEDLAKAKGALASSTAELQSLKIQLDEARAVAAAVDKTDKDEVIVRLQKELSNARDDHAALTDMFVATKESLTEVSRNHIKELEEAAKGRAEEVTKLRAVHQEELSVVTSEKFELQTKLSDLEGELATIKATLATESVSSTKSNGTSHARTSSVSRDELQKLHEAHNLKVHDLQAGHERAIKALREQHEIALAKADELQQEVARKAMEIQYLETDQDESQDQITRYVKIFGLKSFVGAMCTLAVVYGLF